MLKSDFSKYRGALRPPQIASGINAARRNARRLADDAKLLLEADRYPTAAAMAVLSIEESGKITILRQFASIPDTERKRLWREYQSHQKKNVMWILPDLVASGARDLDSLAPAADTSGEHTALLDQIKQISLYTDCLGNAHWTEPEKVIDREVANRLVSTADLLARSSFTTETEIELWKKHMAPVYGAPMDVQKAALVNWFSAMKENGLRDKDDTPPTIEEFLFGEAAPTADE
ncbi:MAG: AbiV family abortive infection protein [Rhodospirillaceae bacterium]|nr:AbiV family abortive infection protein [Rhodospirillaceae bacterium]MDE0615982.1 AbiV family abortive infection protein [Rhodospirillaceae bacterium]